MKLRVVWFHYQKCYFHVVGKTTGQIQNATVINVERSQVQGIFLYRYESVYFGESKNLSHQIPNQDAILSYSVLYSLMGFRFIVSFSGNPITL
jgi:hypothetical protein